MCHQQQFTIFSLQINQIYITYYSGNYILQRFNFSKKVNFVTEATIVCFCQWPQHLVSHIVAYGCYSLVWPKDMLYNLKIVTTINVIISSSSSSRVPGNISYPSREVFYRSTAAATVHWYFSTTILSKSHSSVWPKDMFYKSQRDYVWSMTATVHCSDV